MDSITFQGDRTKVMKPLTHAINCFLFRGLPGHQGIAADALKRPACAVHHSAKFDKRGLGLSSPQAAQVECALCQN